MVREFRKLDQGFTLIELAVIIVILGVLAVVAMPVFSNFTNSAKINATREEMNTIKRAIVGNPTVVSGGQLIDRGFEGDCGFVPSALIDLTRRPDTVPPYDRLTRIGWNGPYLDSSRGEYLRDAWGNNYTYDPAGRRVISTGTGDTVKF
ncbi:MAG: prepilin-type N-terminal cleavage/methylation domain-containing protein [candidate division Zixibacteria bacterium]|nr:prepilin-type N-terminal cleavage/methylation domain-containing protein [candidate division Zixibacteria bacterium]